MAEQKTYMDGLRRALDLVTRCDTSFAITVIQAEIIAVQDRLLKEVTPAKLQVPCAPYVPPPPPPAPPVPTATFWNQWYLDSDRANVGPVALVDKFFGVRSQDGRTFVSSSVKMVDWRSTARMTDIREWRCLTPKEIDEYGLQRGVAVIREVPYLE